MKRRSARLEKRVETAPRSGIVGEVLNIPPDALPASRRAEPHSTSVGEIAVVQTRSSSGNAPWRRLGGWAARSGPSSGSSRLSLQAAELQAGDPGSSSTATSGRSCRTTASPATAPTRTTARPSCGSTSGTRRSSHEAIVPGKPDESELVDRDLQRRRRRGDAARRSRTRRSPPRRRSCSSGGSPRGPSTSRTGPTSRRSGPPVPTVEARGAGSATRSTRSSWPTLEAKGIAPSPEADRRTLLRRLSLDLTGLPPTPEEVDAFVDDTSPDAYEKLVDRLLASPHYGERMAVPWLDLVRFADTVGYHGDQNQNVFPYRDYVIDAFNAQQAVRPVHDRATRRRPAAQPDHRAARRDRLQPPEHDDPRGRGPAEGVPGQVRRRPRADGRRHLARLDAWAAASATTTSSTRSRTKDFYSLAAFFADVKQWGVYHDYGYTPNPDLSGWSNDHPFPPEIEVDSPYLQRRQRAAARRRSRSSLARPSATLDGRRRARPRSTPGARQSRAFLEDDPTGWATPRRRRRGDRRPKAAARRQRRLRRPTADGPRPSEARPTDLRRSRSKPAPAGSRPIRLELLPHPAHGGKIVRGGGRERRDPRSRRRVQPQGRRRHDAARVLPRRRRPQGRRGTPTAYAILGVQDGWKTSTRARQGDADRPSGCLDTPGRRWPTATSSVVDVTSDSVGCVRVSRLARSRSTTRPSRSSSTPTAQALLPKPRERDADQRAARGSLPARHRPGTPTRCAEVKPL